MDSLKDKTKDGLKRELGIVYHLCVKLHMEKGDIANPDGGTWSKSFPFVKSLQRFIIRDVLQHFRLPPEFIPYANEIIRSLLKDQKAEIKHEGSGRWLQLYISVDPCLEYWPPDNKIIRKS